MGIRYIQRENGVIVGSFAQPQPGFADEAMDESNSEYIAWIASLVEPPSISLEILQKRIDAEGMWDTYVNYMFNLGTRRNAFLKVMFLGHPILTTDNGFKNSLLNAGCTQAQVDRIMAA
jgi:hypothetical protein